MFSGKSALTVQFYFGIGSRYSYLAATQLPRLAADTQARFEWRPLDVRTLIERAGSDPFRPNVRRGQYDPAFRTRDGSRWAAYYGVPYREPDWERTDWRTLSLAAVAAGRLGAVEAFSMGLLEECFAQGRAPADREALARIAGDAGLDRAAFLDAVASPETAARHQHNLDDAFKAGAFGVPTFVLPNGELYWGQDRIPLLRHRLTSGESLA
ncbi:MAG: 2-hydroxychromene-2-carboxylate isomerase [Alphaproteobacteria bacterium]